MTSSTNFSGPVKVQGRYVATLSADGSSLVDGAGNVLSFAGPAYTWVNLPAASLNAGNTVRVTDVGASAAGSLWISDGVYWRPLNGSLVLASERAGQPGTPIAVATSFSKLSLPAGPMIVSGSLVLPVGLLRPGVGLRINSFMRHTGTAGTWGGVFRIGTANTSSDSPLAVGQGSATNDQTMWTFMDANCAANGVITTAYNMQPNAAASSGSYAARTTNIDLTQVMYLGIHVNAITAPDTIELQSYSITLVD